MTLTLSTADLASLVDAARLLASPLEFATVDAWRSAVNRALKELMGADTAGFLLPGVDGPLVYSDEHDPAELARYGEMDPPPLADGSTAWQRMAAVRVATISTVYGADVARYVRSAYYNEYAAPNGARQTLAAMLPLAPGEPHPLRMVGLQLWRGGGIGRGSEDFGERELQLLTLLLPSLAAGAAALGQWDRHRAALLPLIDALGQAVLVCDVAGRAHHRTPALAAVLLGDPEAPTLLAKMHEHARHVARQGAPRKSATDAVHPPARELRTALAAYRVWATTYSGPAERDPLIVVALERLTRTAPSAQALRARFALTMAESRVALLLAGGRPNVEIAEALGVGESTARRHTERVLRKLGVRSRAAVAARLAELS